jgi:hypothetical protein
MNVYLKASAVTDSVNAQPVSREDVSIALDTPSPQAARNSFQNQKTNSSRILAIVDGVNRFAEGNRRGNVRCRL